MVRYAMFAIGHRYWTKNSLTAKIINIHRLIADLSNISTKGKETIKESE